MLKSHLTPRTPEQEAGHWRKQYMLSRQEIGDLICENNGLRETLKTEGKMLPWDLSKVARQRKALHRLHGRVRAQRFQLRHINMLGRGLSAAEYRAARAAERDKSLDLIPEELPE
jgi:hypothetical protein